MFMDLFQTDPASEIDRQWYVRIIKVLFSIISDPNWFNFHRETCNLFWDVILIQSTCSY